MLTHQKVGLVPTTYPMFGAIREAGLRSLHQKVTKWTAVLLDKYFALVFVRTKNQSSE